MADAHPVRIADLAAFATPLDGSGACTEALVHRTPHAQVVVQVVPGGGAMQPHRHSGLWDYFVGLRGEADVVLSWGDEQAPPSTQRVAAGGFLAVPPGMTHEVRNRHAQEPFVFLLTQAPYSKFNFIVD